MRESEAHLWPRLPRHAQRRLEKRPRMRRVRARGRLRTEVLLRRREAQLRLEAARQAGAMELAALRRVLPPLLAARVRMQAVRGLLPAALMLLGAAPLLAAWA